MKKRNVVLLLLLVPVLVFGQLDITRRKLTIDTIRARVDSIYLKGPVSLNGVELGQGGGGNPVLSGVTANDTTRWATDTYNVVLQNVTASDTTRWASGGGGGITEIDSATVVSSNLATSTNPEFLVSFEGNRFKKIPIDTTNVGATMAAYGEGSGNFALSTTIRLVDFDNVDPQITLNQSGTYLIFVTGIYFANNVTTTTQNVEYKIRRTNNTAEDLPNSLMVARIGTYTTMTFGNTFSLPPFAYVTNNTDDVLEVWARISGALGGGTFEIVRCNIVALKIL